MNEPGEIKDFGPYEALRCELMTMQRQFERAADRYHGLYHELIHPPGTALPRSVWSAFIQENSATDGKWEQWDLFPSLTRCGRFHGNGSGVEEFLRLAESSYLLLRALERLAQRGNQPQMASGLYFHLRTAITVGYSYSMAPLRPMPPHCSAPNLFSGGTPNQSSRRKLMTSWNRFARRRTPAYWCRRTRSWCRFSMIFSCLRLKQSAPGLMSSNR